jgi:putative acyl-CoA dehydrogenase
VRKAVIPIYDPRNIPATEKEGVTLGMSMTERQGGSVGSSSLMLLSG